MFLIGNKRNFITSKITNRNMCINVDSHHFFFPIVIALLRRFLIDLVTRKFKTLKLSSEIFLSQNNGGLCSTIVSSNLDFCFNGKGWFLPLRLAEIVSIERVDFFLPVTHQVHRLERKVNNIFVFQLFPRLEFFGFVLAFQILKQKLENSSAANKLERHSRTTF